MFGGLLGDQGFGQRDQISSQSGLKRIDAPRVLSSC